MVKRMAFTNVPMGFNSSFLIRIFIPGFIAAILYSIAWAPIFFDSFWASLTIENKLIFWIVLGTVFGLLINSIDIYIYQFFEGINWPNRIREWKYDKIKNYFNKLDGELKELEKNINRNCQKSTKIETNTIIVVNRSLCRALFSKVRNKIFPTISNDLHDTMKQSKLWAEIRKFPYHPDKKSYSLRYPLAATIFGNVLYEYENYSEKQYGMHMMVFWQHLWFILPKDIKEDIDLLAAKTDFIVYLSFIFLSYSFIGGIGFYIQKDTWNNVLTFDLPVSAIILFFISIIFCLLLYNISISNHISYGRYIKATFDLYRFELAKRLKIDTYMNDDLQEQWLKYRYYILDYYREKDEKDRSK